MFSREGVGITLLGGGVNLVLAGLKLSLVASFGSAALVADGVHSLTDLATDLVVIGGIRLAARPADHTHAYGHGKFETLAGGLVAVALALAGGWLIWDAAQALFASSRPPGGLVLGIAFLSLVTKEWLFRLTHRVASRLASQALAANAWHHRSDAFSSGAVLLGGGAVLLGYPSGDQLAAMAVGALVILAALSLVGRTLHELSEGTLPEEDRRRIVAAIEAVPGVKGWHRLRTRRVGRQSVVDVHLQVAPELSVKEAHDIATQVEEAVAAALGGRVSVMVHVEPFLPTSAD
jgi:cation diffusion facilitator family transporter